MRFELHHGDCREVMRTFDADSIDACVTDPPYDLTSGTGRGFMGKAWDGTGVAFDPATWAEVFRVLRPGAHLLAFGGTRTSHRMVCAIEDAGFEIRDSLVWVHGQGFPKNADVSKAIDKAAGAEREVVGAGPHAAHRQSQPFGQGARQDSERDKRPLTAPATEAAREWSGWGTALKPAHEPICLARKPLVGTVAANVLAHGTGAINVGVCRVEAPGGLTMGGRCVGSSPNPMNRANGQAEDRERSPEHPAGRYPPNLLLSHSPDCVRRVQTHWSGNGKRGVTAPGVTFDLDSDGKRAGSLCNVHTDADGMEEVESWECAEGCPVAELDRQAGARRSAGFYPSASEGTGNGVTYLPTKRQGPLYDDTGGCSRFFPVFYAPKAAQAERKKGVGKNGHPTVKSVSLCRWLVRLITPPGGTLLDPFLGSGSIGVAALEEGFAFIGIEQAEEYLAIARGRLAAVNPQLGLA